MRDIARRLWGLLGLGRRAPVEVRAPARGRGPTDHVILIDGTMSSLEEGQETNIGRIYRTLRAVPQSARMSIYYEPGVQWRSWRDARDVAMGKGINRQIQRAYGWLATRYRPGDRVFLFGFSRGAYAVRSLAGIIDQVGLLRADCATERNVQLAYRYYRRAEPSRIRDIFVRRHCQPQVQIEMVGAFDTVKALGLRLPFLWMWTEPQHDFHSHALGPHIRHGYQALALDETRAAYWPILRGTPWRGGRGQPCRTGLVSRHAWRHWRPARRFCCRATAGQHSAGLDAGTGGTLRAGAAGRLARRFPDRPRRPLGRVMARLGAGVPVPRPAGDWPGPVRGDPPDRAGPVAGRAPRGQAARPCRRRIGEERKGPEDHASGPSQQQRLRPRSAGRPRERSPARNRRRGSSGGG